MQRIYIVVTLLLLIHAIFFIENVVEHIDFTILIALGSDLTYNRRKRRI